MDRSVAPEWLSTCRNATGQLGSGGPDTPDPPTDHAEDQDGVSIGTGTFFEQINISLHLRNDVLCVGWNVKPILTSFTTFLYLDFDLRYDVILDVVNCKDYLICAILLWPTK